MSCVRPVGDPSGADANEPVARGTAKVVNPQGLHARPISSFVQLASRYACRVEVDGPGGRADGRSVLSMMGLAAPQGAELSIKATGADAEQAVEALKALVESGFGER